MAVYNVPNGNTIQIPCGDTNVLLETRVMKAANKRRSASPFTHMERNRKGKIVLIRPKSSGFLWSKAKPCTSEPNGTIGLNRTETVGCLLKSHLRFCPDLDKTCFDSLTEVRSGKLELADFEPIMDAMMDTQMQEASAQLFQLLLLSSFHETAGRTIDTSTMSQKDLEYFKEINSLDCKGIMAQILKQGTECKEAIPAGLKGEGCTIDGLNILDAFEKLVCCAQQKSDNILSVIAADGYTGADGVNPVIMLSSSLMPLVTKAYQSQANPNTQIAPLLTLREVDGVPTYFYMNIPIDNRVEYNAWDKYYNVKTLFMGLTYTGILQIHSSADDQSLDGSDVGYTIYQEPNPIKRGLTEAYTEVIVGAAIGDADAVVYSLAFAVPN